MAENIVMTRKARKKLAKAHGGAAALPVIGKIAYGSGGHDLFGRPVMPDETMEAVPGEFIRKPLEAGDIAYPEDTTVRIRGMLDFSEGNGKEVSAVGLYDSEDDLIMIKTFVPIVKNEETSIETTCDEIF